MADDAVQSFIDAYGQSDTSELHIPEHMQRIHKCCCGNDACAYLKHNQVALESLERDVRTAAKLGQVCRLVYNILLSPCWYREVVAHAHRSSGAIVRMRSLFLPIEAAGE